MSKTLSRKSVARLHAAQSPTGCTRPESLFGLWAIKRDRFDELVKTAKSIDLVALAASRRMRADGAPGGPLPTLSPETPGKKKRADYDDAEMDGPESDSIDDDPGYKNINGIAVFSVSGPMTKYETSFQDILGGTATLPLRRALRAAASDPDVMCGVLCIDSPGGTVSGMTDLADDIDAFDQAKGCYAYISDLGCSAAYWAASQCRKIFANDGALVGCIGTMAVLEDTSKAYAQQGVQVHVVTSDVPGDDTMKGAGVDGAPVTDDQLADFKRQANEQNDLFVADVAAGRNMTPDRVRALADGRVHIGSKALALGLVDEVASFDSAMQAIFNEAFTMTSESFRAFALANPEDDAVKSLIAQGHKAGMAQGRNDARAEQAALLAAFPDRPQFASEQFAKGHDVQAAKADLADVLTAELADSRKLLAEHKTRATDDNPAVRIPSPDHPSLNKHADAASPEGALKAFEDAWQAEVKTGATQASAIAKVVREKPELHAAYLAAAQVGRKAAVR